MTKKLALIDGYGFVFRAYHSLPALTRKDQTPVGAVYGFTNMLIKLLSQLDVSHIGVVFDAGSKTFRNEIYPEYKANRPPCPEDLLPQFPIVREAAESLNLAILEKPGFEADDIIATLAKEYDKKNYEVVIVSSDKDLMQLINDNVKMYDAMKNKTIGEKEVFDKFSVKPKQVLDVLSLMGDSSDNVPGVRGIGPKTAAELIQKFGDLEGILSNLDQIPQKKRKEMLAQDTEKARLSKTLITLKDNVELGINEDDLALKDIDPHKLITFLSQQGFRSLVQRVKKEFKISPEIIAEEISLQKPEQQIRSVKSANFDEIKQIKIENNQKLQEIIQKINKNELIIIDFEENFENFTSLTISSPKNDEILQEIYYFELENNSQDLFAQKNNLDEEIFYQEIAKILKNPAINKIFFDSKRFLRLFNQKIELNSFEDISLINHLLNSSIKNNFRELVDFNLDENIESRNFGEIFVALGKSKIPEQFQDDKIKQEFYSFKNYGLFQLYKILFPKIFRQKLNNSYHSYEKPLILALAEMEKNGVKIDTQKLAALSEEFGAKIQQLTTEIHQIAGEEFNIASPQQLGKILFEKLELKSSKKSKKTGALSTKSSVLEELEHEGHAIAGKILEFRKFSKLKNTYTDALPKEINPKTNRIHSNFATTATITGRLSSSNPNLQNIPIRSPQGQKIREAFIADKGNLLISADYSQVELRVIAHVAKIEALIKAFKDDKDIHKITAAQIFACDESEVSKEQRSQAKAINFGIIYGISAFGLAKQLDISRKDAAKYIEKYMQTYPGIEKYMQDYQEFARQNGFVKTIGGRKCFISGINHKNPIVRSENERLAINAPIQGSAADIIKKAMIKLNKKLKNLEAKIILQIHDELIIETKEENAQKIAEIVKEEMENAMILDCPLKVDVEIGKYWL